MRPSRLIKTAAVSCAMALAATTLGASAVVVGPLSSPAVQECIDGHGHDDSAARVRKGATAQEPPLYEAKQAKQYGLMTDLPTLAPGSVTIETYFHVITETGLTDDERARLQAMVDAQMDVLNAAYAGTTAPDAVATPFRFELVETNFVENDAWAHVTPGKPERDMKRALHEGDSETLNVYVADIGGGLLGWAYFPKGYNPGQAYIDGVVMLDESMPGGTLDPYNEGDTLVHEVGHWLMLEHTFAHGCSAVGDGVADTPAEAYPQFYCDAEDPDTCERQPGVDPVHNFMDYTEDSCLNMFTQGQADRMSDAWQEFRAGGNG
jgi:hypothetical protein